MHSNMEFKCTHCDKSFSQNGNLKVHISRMHEEKVLIPCSLCEKSFSSKQKKFLHELTHQGIKRFKCSKCEKAFTEEIPLLKHTATVHPEPN